MKTLKYTLLAALSIFAAASCTKESTGDIQQPSAGVDVKAVFEAVAEDDMSKALLQSNGGLQWENGDQIAVYQYGQYAAGTNRDNTKNIFTSDGTCVFSGVIAGYQPLVEADLESGADKARYYAAYPASRCHSCGISTGKYVVSIPTEQTGLFSDFAEHAMYLGSLDERNGECTSYEADTQTLIFLESFDMFCMTPVLKFNVPASLNVSKIVLTATDVNGVAVNIAGKIEVRSDSHNTQPAVKTAASEITIGNDESVLSGDVYVVIAPDSNQAHSTIERRSQFKSSAKTLTLNLSTPHGATAALKLPLNGEILAGTIKNLPAIPETITWDYPAGPGLSAIEINKTSITSTSGSTLGARTRILLTPENTESTITYRSRTSLSSLVESTIMNPYNSTNGILRSDADTPENYLEINVATEDYKDFTAYACVWILNKDYGFGAKMSADAGSLSPVVGSTYPTDGTYLYNLSYLYEIAPTAGTNTIPQFKTEGFNMYNASTNGTQWSGSLRIKSPGTGNARLYFDCTLVTNSRTITVQKNDVETVDQIATGAKEVYGAHRVVHSDFFDVSAEDILKISLSKNVQINSITLLWEPTETEASLATESYASKTSYGN